MPKFQRLLGEIFLSFSQMYGICILSLSLMKKRWILISVHLLIPVVTMTLFALVNVITDRYVEPNFNELLKEKYSQVEESSEFFFPSFSIHELQYAISLQFDDLEIPQIVLMEESSNTNVGECGSDPSEREGLLGESIWCQFQLLNSNSTGVVFKNSDDGQIIDEIYRTMVDEEWNENPFSYLGGIFFLQYDENKLKYDVIYERKFRRPYPVGSATSVFEAMLNGYTSQTDFCEKVGHFTGAHDCSYAIGSGIVNVINSAAVKTKTGRRVVTRTKHFPYRSSGLSFDSKFTDYLMSVAYSFLLTALLPLFSYLIVKDKECGARKLMGLMGMRKRNYVFSKMVVFFILSMTYYLVMFIFGVYVFKYRIFTMINAELLWVFFILLSLVLPSFSFLFSVFFKKAFLSLFLGYFFSMIINALVWGGLEQVIGHGKYWLRWLDYIFPFGPMQMRNLLNEPTVYHHVWINFDYILNPEVVVTLINMFFSSFLYIFLFFWLEPVFPQDMEKRRYIWWMLNPCLRKFPFFSRRGENDSENGDENELFEVSSERNFVNRMKEEELENCGFVVKNIGKKFGNFQAVKGVSFHAEKHSFHALLGPNGCGKTTTINMLIGEISHSFGEGYVGGFKISENIGKIRENIGVCPQFDIIYPELTCRQHLLFYSRLRGLSLWKQHDYCEDIMNKLHLWSEDHDEKKSQTESWFSKFIHRLNWSREQPAGKLSQGHKRRLSIAIALIGEPKIVFLDEPTSSLDIKSKEKIWGILENLKNEKKCCVLMTTHMLSEADRLADKLTILGSGRVLCHGKAFELKEKHGDGYIVRTWFKKNKKNLLGRLPKDSKLSKETDRCCVYDIPMVSSTAELMVLFETLKNESTIEDYSISQTSLEDVYINLVSSDEENKDKMLSKDEFLSEKVVYDDAAVIEDSEKERRVENCFKLFFIQLWYLLKRHCLAAVRNRPVVLIGQLLFPAVSLFGLLILVLFIGTPDFRMNYTKEPVFKFYDCVSFVDGGECFHFVYTTNNDSFSEKIMDLVIEKYETSFEGLSFREFDNTSHMESWIMDHPNETISGVSFSKTDESDDSVEYELYYNSTTLTTPNGDVTSLIFSLQISIDNAVIQLDTDEEDFIDEIRLQPYPMFPLKQSHAQKGIYSNYSGFFYTFALIFVMIYAANFYVDDKQKGIQEYFFVNGASAFVVDFSYTVYFVLFAFISSCVCYVCSLMTYHPLFTECDFFVAILILIIYSLAILSWGSVVFPLLQTSIQVQSFSLCFILISFLSPMIMSNINISSMYEWGDDIRWITWGFLPLLYPTWNFCGLIGAISFKTVPIFDYEKRKYVDNVGFKFVDLFKKGDYPNLSLETPAPFVFILFLVANIIFFFISQQLIRLVYDNRHIFVIIFRMMKDKLLKRSHDTAVRDSSKLDGVVSCNKVKKSFNAYTKVLEDLDFSVPRGECVVLSGPDGSGKTTLCRILTRCTRFDQGFVKVFKNKYSSRDVRLRRPTPKFCGICPQNLESMTMSLSAKEALEMYGCLKGLQPKYAKEVASKLLNNFGNSSLKKFQNKRIRNYSGGMKRLCLILISLIGSGPMLIFDEIFEGIDVETRFIIRKLILDLKKTKSILLVSHEFEEIEHLIDKLAILFEMKIREFGSPADLKKKYNCGYRLTFQTASGEELKSYLAKNLPESKMISHHNTNSGTKFEYNVDDEQMKRLIEFVQKLENEDKNLFLGGDLEWNISHQSLEDVYTCVTEKDYHRQEVMEIVIEKPLALNQIYQETVELVEIDERQPDQNGSAEKEEPGSLPRSNKKEDEKSVFNVFVDDIPTKIDFSEDFFVSGKSRVEFSDVFKVDCAEGEQVILKVSLTKTCVHYVKCVDPIQNKSFVSSFVEKVEKVCAQEESSEEEY